MRRLPLLCLLLAALASGCRQEDWRTVELPLPEGLSEPEALAAITALDRQTPPAVTRSGELLILRYASLRVAPLTFRPVLQSCQEKL